MRRAGAHTTSAIKQDESILIETHKVDPAARLPGGDTTAVDSLLEQTLHLAEPTDNLLALLLATLAGHACNAVEQAAADEPGIVALAPKAVAQCRDEPDGEAAFAAGHRRRRKGYKHLRAGRDRRRWRRERRKKRKVGEGKDMRLARCRPTASARLVSSAVTRQGTGRVERTDRLSILLWRRRDLKHNLLAVLVE